MLQIEQRMLRSQTLEDDFYPTEIGVSITCPLTDYPVCENCVIPLCIVMQSAELATGVLTIQLK